jgi:hypothetical protein
MECESMKQEAEGEPEETHGDGNFGQPHFLVRGARI